MRNEYLLGVGVDDVGAEGMMGDEVFAGDANEEGSALLIGTAGAGRELEGVREEGGVKVDIVGRAGGIAVDETEVLELEVLSQTSKLTCVR